MWVLGSSRPCPLPSAPAGFLVSGSLSSPPSKQQGPSSSLTRQLPKLRQGRSFRPSGRASRQGTDFWVPEMLPILGPHLLDASTQPLPGGVALSVGNSELQGQLGRQVGGASCSPAPGWSSEPLPKSSGMAQLLF